MNAMKLQQIQMLYFLWLLPLFVIMFVYAWHKRRKSLELFLDAGLIERIPISVSYGARIGKALIILAALIFLIIGMTRPAWNPKPETIERRGRDVVFVLDVSKSMLAEDLYPNRLERAKLAILDCIDRLPW